MIISLIVAHDPNLLIGSEGGLPWHYREDLKHFKNTTMGYPLLMGRRVFEEIGERPLPGRRCVVLSRSRNYPDVEVCRSLKDAFRILEGEEKVYVIGGEGVYRETIDDADELVVTDIKKKYEGDTWFPEYRDGIGSEWIEVERESSHPELDFIRYQRNRS